MELFSILLAAHPNVKVFVTHCGMHGVIESLTFGVPMVGIPVFGDQKDVLVRLEERQLALGLDKYSNSQQILASLQTVLDDSR